MVLKMVSGAVLALLLGMGAAQAQSRDFGGPRPAPPASFKGQSYTDSRGCVFLRAGFGGQTTWVPRVTRSRQQVCSGAPSGGRVEVSEAPVVRAAPAPAPVPSTGNRRPLDTVASTTTPPRIRARAQQRVAPVYAPPVVQQAPRVAVAPNPPRGTGAVRVPSVAGSGKIGCYSDAPVAERFEVRGGGSIVMCTRGDGNLANARAPRLPGGAAAVAPSGFVEGNNRVARQIGGRLSVSSQDVNTPPKGYKAAWDDDRLNPRRGQGTRQGWYDQDELWTREVPARTYEDLTPREKAKVNKARNLSVSSKSAPAKVKAGGGRSYVQVGTFGQASNASGASSRLAGLGLPVARQNITKGDRALQVVMVGPFASGAEAQAALRAARQAGFSDAFIR